MGRRQPAPVENANLYLMGVARASGVGSSLWRKTVSKELGVLIKEEIYAPNGDLLGSLEAISIE